MPSVQLIVTGKMEKSALHKSLKRAFAEEELEFLEPIYVDGFTSALIKLDQPCGQPPSVIRTVDKLVDALFSFIQTGRNGECPDMTIVIEDLEVANFNQPQVVIDYFRQSVQFKINKMQQQSNLKAGKKIIQRLQEDCSFHLFVPMTEAYFFGEGQTALDRAGAQIPSTISGITIDVEDFLVQTHIHNGVDYLQSQGNSYWSAGNTSQRPRHPKRYLDFLCCPEVTLNKELRYRETKGGLVALNDLDWAMVCSDSTRVRYLRSLFEDIADRFNIKHPYPGISAPLTRCTNRKILRNM